MIVISDTSAVKALCKINRLSIFQTLFTEIIIPEAVNAELAKDNVTLPAFVEIRKAKNIHEINRISAILDPGEAEAIVLAKELKADFLIIDEKLGRSVAKAEGLRIIGVLGILKIAKDKGIISSIKEILDDLEKKDSFWISDQLRTEILKSANEL